MKELSQKAAYWISDRILELIPSRNFLVNLISIEPIIISQQKIRV